MSRTIPLLCLFLTSCGAGVDSELQPYFDRFSREVMPVGDVGGRFVETGGEPGMWGRCELKLDPTAWEKITGQNRPVVEINRDAWKIASFDQKMVIVYHELGHALHGAEHRGQMIDDFCPMSLLYGSPFGEAESKVDCYRQNWFYYTQELKK
jgi:hypothetical protein